MRVFEAHRDITMIELADALGCGLWTANQWRDRLVEAGRVERAEVRVPLKPGTKGAQAWRLTPRAARPRMVRLGDRVVTPSNRAGVVLEVTPDGRFEVEFTEGEGCVQIAPPLLALWPKGAERPAPVRVR